MRVSWKFFVEPQMIYGWTSLSLFAVWFQVHMLLAMGLSLQRPPSAGLGIWPWPSDDSFWNPESCVACYRFIKVPGPRHFRTISAGLALSCCAKVLVKLQIDLHQAAAGLHQNMRLVRSDELRGLQTCGLDLFLLEIYHIYLGLPLVPNFWSHSRLK